MRTLLVFVSVLLLIWIPSPPKSAAQSVWATEEVASGAGVGQSCAITLDSQYSPHVAYVVGSNIVYAKRAAYTWTIETAGTSEIQFVRRATITLDPLGSPAIAYVAAVSTTAGLFLARKTAGQWNTEPVYLDYGTVPDSPYDVELAFDSHGQPHIAFSARNGSVRMIAYAIKTAGSWDHEQVGVDLSDGGPPFLSIECDLLVDSADTPHIVVNLEHYVTGPSVYYTTRGGLEDWGNVLVYSGLGAPGDCGLSLTSGGEVRTVFSDGIGGTLRYASRSAGQWTIETLNTSGFDWGGEFLSLGLAPDGSPRVAFRPTNGGSIATTYAKKTPGNWSATSLLGNYATALALHPSDLPFVVSQDADGFGFEGLRLNVGGSPSEPHPFRSSYSVSGGCGASSPRVVRLCPAGDMDTTIVSILVRDINYLPLIGRPFGIQELTGGVNVVNPPFGSYTGSSGQDGWGAAGAWAASGNGTVAVCVDGVRMWEFDARSPDVARSSLNQCGFASHSGLTSVVLAHEVTNPQCGFSAHMGDVASDNAKRWWDLNCDAVVDDGDIYGTDGVREHLGHTGTLGPRSTCTGALAALAKREVGEEASSGEWVIVGISPNPTPGASTIRFRLQPTDEVRVEIVDVAGRVVERLRWSRLDDQTGEAYWDGSGSDGREVASGIYFARVVADHRVQTGRITVLK